MHIKILFLLKFLSFQSKSEVRTLAQEFAPEAEENKISALQAKSIFSQVSVSSSAMNPFASGKEAAASLNPFASKAEKDTNPFSNNS